MCKVTVLTLLLTCLATVSLSQSDVIGVYSDATGTDCNIVDDTSNFVTVYVVHTSSVGATASSFRAPEPNCFSASWLSDTYAFPIHVGDSQNGVAINYGSCQTGSFLVLEISYYAPGVTPDCCPYTVLAHDGTLPPIVEVSDCSFVTQAGVGGTSQINKTAACDCCVPGTIYVPPYPNIQSAIDAACPGDTIVLADSTYTGTGNRDIFIDKPITICSASGDPALCVIDCQGSGADPHSGFELDVGAVAVNFEGITIKGGYNYGIHHFTLSGTRIAVGLKNCRLTDNGTGFRATYCDAYIIHCELDNHVNQALHFEFDGNIVVDSCVVRENGHGGIFAQEGMSVSLSNSRVAGNVIGAEIEDRGTLVIDNCEIVGNDQVGVKFGVDENTITNSKIMSNGWGMSICGSQPVDIAGSVIAHNTDGVLRMGCANEYVTFNDCTMYGNSGIVIDAGGAIGFTYVGIARCIIAFNSTTLTIDSPDSLYVDCTDIYGNASGDWAGTGFSPFQGINGNISEDPEFCDAANGNFYLSQGSPCLAPCGTMGAFGEGCASDYPNLQSVVDVPGDQGGWVTLQWIKSKYDDLNLADPMPEYWIYRDSDPVGSAFIRGENKDAAEAAGMHPAGWVVVDTVPAVGDSIYQWVVPTMCDSTISLGMCMTGYYISARMEFDEFFFDSIAKRGYSVDNLAPGLPQNVTAAYNTGNGNYLTWDRPGDPDVAYCGVYRDDELIAYVMMDEWTDPEYDGWNVTYEITAVDTSGNEGGKVGPGQSTAVEPPRMPDTFKLHQNTPNPFNPTTTIRYDVPASGGHVAIKVYDVAGRLVRTLVNARKTPGEKTITWNGRDNNGASVATGVYFYKMTATGYTKTRKMVLVQ